MKSSLSVTLDSSKETSLLFKISSWIPLFLISPCNWLISPVKMVISDSASSLYLVATAILLLYSVISSSHSDSWALWSWSASAYWVAKSVLISAKSLAMSPRGDLFFIWRAMVSKIFFPKLDPSTCFNWLKTE